MNRRGNMLEIFRNNETKTTAQSRRTRHGHAALELVCSAFFLFVFAVLSADICVVLFGAYQNDRACRDAARSAAQGQDASQSTKLANAALRAHAGDGYYFSNPVLDRAIVYNDFGGMPPTGTSPFVNVTTRTSARVPFSPLRFSADAVFLDGGTVTFKQSYTFPIVRTK